MLSNSVHSIGESLSNSVAVTTSVARGVAVFATGRLTRNRMTYNAGRLINVKKVATERPPMIAIAIGPQKTLRVSGIIAKIAVAAVKITGRARLTEDSITASHSLNPFSIS